jgi:hypothetical protein
MKKRQEGSSKQSSQKSIPSEKRKSNINSNKKRDTKIVPVDKNQSIKALMDKTQAKNTRSTLIA